MDVDWSAADEGWWLAGGCRWSDGRKYYHGITTIRVVLLLFGWYYQLAVALLECSVLSARIVEPTKFLKI